MQHLCRDFLDSALQGLHVCTHDRISIGLAILEHNKCRHGPHVHLLCDLTVLIDVHLDEAHVGVGFAELSDNGRDSLAGTAPGREEVDDDGTGGCEGLEDDRAKKMAVSNCESMDIA